ncbi:MAG: aldehyde dehydrogenase family protein [Gammaproteobacteria bacterium]|nr:MAG: aldehyde dehydrogenase family protein [Gammaproteobacteria bacterium]
MSRRYDLIIDGKSVPADDYAEIRSPSTGEVVGLAAQASRAQLDDAVGAAQQAFAGWRCASDETRSEACAAVAGAITEHQAELAELLSREQGKPLKGLGAEFELQGCIGWAGFTAQQSLPVKVIEDSEERRVEEHRVPIGVVGSITPWNWPLMIAVWHILPAIRTGNAVVIKPSPFTPLGTLRLVEIMNEVLPPGLVNAIAGGDELGAELSRHPDIRKLVFTGSIPTGSKVMASAASDLKRVTLELGGNDPAIVLPDADPAAIAEGLYWGAMINSGQTCGAIKRLYVHDALYDAVAESLLAIDAKVPMGDGLDTNNLLGPLQNERQYRKVIELVEDAKARGARILCGGEPTDGPGYFYPVTFVADIEDGAPLVDDEQFGPVLPIIRYTEVDDAVRRANGTSYGLDASVWGRDPEQLADVAARLEAGTVFINKHADIAPHIPFGGVKCSGLGVEFGEEGLAAYTDIKIINAAV